MDGASIRMDDAEAGRRLGVARPSAGPGVGTVSPRGAGLQLREACRDGGALNSPEEIPTVPGRHITDQQAKLYMNLRRTHTRETAAAKAGFGASTGGRLIESVH